MPRRQPCKIQHPSPSGYSHADPCTGWFLLLLAEGDGSGWQLRYEQ